MNHSPNLETNAKDLELLSLVSAGTNDGIWDWNLETDEVYYSPSCFSMLGYDKAEFPATIDTWKNLIHPHDQHRLFQELDGYLKDSNKNFEIDIRLKHKGGRAVFVFLRITKVYSELSNKPVRLVAMQIDITAGKVAEQSYLNVFNSLNEAVYALDEDGHFMDVNDGAVRMYGFPQTYFFGKKLADFAAPDRNDMNDVRHKYSLAFNGQPQSIEFWGLRSNGTEFPIEIHMYPGSYFGRNVVFSMATDITEKKSGEVKLQHELDFRNQLFTQASEGIFLWSLSHNDAFIEFQLWNHRMQELTGYSREEMNQKGWLQTIYDNEIQRTKAKETMLAVLDGVINPGKDFEIVTKTGEKRILRISSARMLKDNEYSVLGVIQDVTQSREQEAQLESSNKRFQTLFDSSTDGQWILNMQGDFLNINKTGYERLGYTKEEMMGMKLTELDPPEFAAKVPERLAQIAEHGVAFFETAQYRKDGSIMPIEVNSRVLELDGEKVFFSVARDISERKMMEEQLRHSQKMEAVGTLVGGIAHDFNNMLGALQGNTYLAKLALKDQHVVSEKLANIELLTSRAAETVSQLLTFARKDHVKMKTIHLNKHLQEGCHLAKALVPENISRKIHLCDEDIYIKGDSTQLQQVLFNLLNNAVDAVEDVACPEISCSLKLFTADDSFKHKYPSLQSENFALISIKDNGIGIAQDLLENIFEPFFTTKEVGRGTGLGLAMSHGAIQTHGGVYEVESELGLGTVFYIYLPQCVKEVPPMSLDRERTSVTHNERILLVDDEEELRSTTSEVLKSMGYHVVEATDGEDALRLFKANKESFDLIITDIVMPRMGGLELFDTLQQLGSQSPVILVTGYDKTRVLKGRSQQNCFVLNKPYDFTELSQTIQQLLGK